MYIIIIHTISAFSWEKNPDIERVLNILLNNGSILFVFIGGYLFQHLSFKYKYKKYLTTKFRFVVLPYLVCSVPAIIYFVWFEQRWDVPAWYYSYSKPVQVCIFYLTGKQLIPYWFMSMIFIFYLVSPILIWSDKNKSLYWLLPLWIIISMNIHRGFYPYVNFAHFFSVFVLGMFFCRYRKKTMAVLSTKRYLCLSSALILCFYVLSYMESYIVSGYIEKLILCTVYLSFLYKFDNFIPRGFSVLADLSFGMYFIHSYYISVIKLLYKSNTGNYFSGNLISYFSFTTAIVVFTSLTVFLVKKPLKNYSRYVIGS